MDGRLGSYHLGVLKAHTAFGTEPWNQGSVTPLLQHGLIERTGPPGAYGQVRYRNTDKGNELARHVVLHQGQFQINQ